MTAQIHNAANGWKFVAKIAPFIILLLAGMAVRMPLASSYPFASLLLFLWIASDTMMIALMARTSGKPERRAVLGVLAGASFAVWLGAPPALRDALWNSPVLAVTMSTIIVSHAVWTLARAQQALVRLAVADLTVIHMALFRWGGAADVPPHARAFGYHKHLTPICATLLTLSAIEIAVYHLLIGHWSRTGAIVMFVMSDVGFVYLLGLIKSFRFKPVLLTPEGIHVRAGFLVDQLVPLDRITAVETGFSGHDVRDSATLNLALLAWPNVLLRLDEPMHRGTLLIKRGSFDKLAFRLDDPEPFIRLLAWRLGHRAS